MPGERHFAGKPSSLGKQYRTIGRLRGEVGDFDLAVYLALEVNLHRIAFLRSLKGVLLLGGWRQSSRGPVTRAYI